MSYDGIDNKDDKSVQDVKNENVNGDAKESQHMYAVYCASGNRHSSVLNKLTQFGGRQKEQQHLN